MMSITTQTTLDVDELEGLIKGVEPAAFLAPPRLLRRVIKQHRKIGGVGFLVPHRKGYVIDREALLDCVVPSELGVAPGTEVPPYVFLLVRPDPERLARYSRDEALLKHWQILFHLHIDHAMQQKLTAGSLTPTMVRQRIGRLGLTEFAEVTEVLRQEDYLLPPESADVIYAEFVAVYLTLRRFAPARLPHFFPTLRDLAAVDALVAEDIDVEAIFQATRLPGAPDPAALSPRIMQADGLLGLPLESSRVEPSLIIDQAMLARAAEFDAQSNTVRAAILRTQAGVPGDLSRLSERLQKALDLSDAEAEQWNKALVPLLQPASGAWSQEARLLYDLQSVCLDSEHGIYAVDLVEWTLSLGQLPIKRRLAGHQEVVIVRHLRQAMDRLRLVRVTDAERQQLVHLLADALVHRERLMRERFRPLIASALNDVGLKPANVAEGIGRAKMIEELLDRVVEYGHLNIGNLRDALSRNQMKLPDLQDPGELVLGDPLIRLNRKLAVVLDSVYRRGEIYMRLLHRLSSMAFGNWLGRLLVLFLILPFGLAFFVMITPSIAIEEGEKLTQFIGRLIGFVEQPPAPPPADPDEPRPRKRAKAAAAHTFPMPNLWGVAGLGVFFLLLFHVSSFRSRVFDGVGSLARLLHRVFIHGPVWLVQLPALQAMLHNRLWRIFRRCVLWPTVMAANGGLAAWSNGLEMPEIAGAAVVCFALGIVLFNTNVGRDVEENITDWVLRFWVWLSIDFVPGLLHMIMDVSRRGLEAVEQILYTVNESLRFRGGDNQVAVALKAVLGLFWFWVTYVIRFAVNLLIEPQVNPIKHFPVVTVSHKVCLPMIPALADILRNTAIVGRPTTAATGIIFGIPGIFGFMVWELKENWKLYSANRAPNLKPVLIGSHGETMLRLLHPGFHSGTVPKLFKRLRRAELHGQQKTVRKIVASLHHVGESIAHFVERELLALLRQSKSWTGLTIELGHIRLATNRVLVELHCTAIGEQPLVFAFDHQCGWLLAGVLEVGWLPRLNADQRQMLAAALAGLYKMAGVHLTREQIGASLPPSTFAFSITDDCLVVWTSAEGNADVVYDLNAGPVLAPMPQVGAAPTEMPVLDADRLLFANVPLPWQDWVQTCEGGERPMPVALLPKC